MPAWSHPGTQRTLQPCIRLLMGWKTAGLPNRQLSEHVDLGVGHYHRTRASSTATVRAWPRCREPVTLGGGMHKEKIWSVRWGRWSFTQIQTWDQKSKISGLEICITCSRKQSLMYDNQHPEQPLLTFTNKQHNNLSSVHARVQEKVFMFCQCLQEMNAEHVRALIFHFL